MSRSLILSSMFALAAPSLLGAQTVRWNDRPTTTWSDEAPRVRVYIDGPRGVPVGAPMRVRFEVSDNAYVTVGRVDDEGRLTILFPYSRNQRAAVRAGQVYSVRTPRMGGDFAFVASDRMGGGYIFALASYVPLDFSSFENRDYDRIGGWSRFTIANRSISRRPDVFIDRFAAAVLWNPDTPYDYDVDYYHPVGYPGMLNAYALCGTSAFGHRYGISGFGDLYGVNAFGYVPGWRTYLSQFSSWDRMGYSSLGMCGDWYNRLQCYSALALYSYSGCRIGQVIVQNQPPLIPGQPVDTAGVPNEGVVRGGLFAPTPIPTGQESTLAAERPDTRFDELDNVMSIPTRATRKMKQEDAQREASAGIAPARTGFDRTDATASKPEKGASSGERDAATRLEPPSRQPTKAKATGEPRRETASKGGYGSTGRTSGSTGPDRVSRPADSKPASAPANPPSIQGTTTEKKKPPTN